MTSGKNAKSAREQARSMASKHAPKPKKKFGVKLGIIAAVVAVIALIATIIFVGQKNSIDLSDTTPPQNVAEGISFVEQADPAENAPVVSVYVDFQCPACQMFEQQNGQILNDMAENGEIILEHRPIAILDHTTSTNYASRSANAFACVINEDHELGTPFIETLFQIQPPEGGEGIPNTDLIAAAEEVGATNVAECIENGEFRGWVKDITDKAVEAGINSTPTVLINGEQWNREGNVFDAIEAAKTGETATETAEPTAGA